VRRAFISAATRTTQTDTTAVIALANLVNLG
jgi:hypothetical protein